MNIFITGIGTGVGKTIASAIIVEALKADYWKPIQTGCNEDSDTETVNSLVLNTKSKFHPEAYRFLAPLSAYQAAQLENVAISFDVISKNLSNITPNNANLVIEGAGGILVPITRNLTILDLMYELGVRPIIVSRHYLGSINHTLMTVETIFNRGLNPLGIIFNGNEISGTEELILNKTNLTILGKIYEEKVWNRNLIETYAQRFAPHLKMAIR